MPKAGNIAVLVLLLAASAPALAAPPQRDVQALFAAADRAREVGLARKTKTVDARPAVPGEVIVTEIAGEGEETRSKPAEAGDWVVRNRCPETGNERYLVKADRFDGLYEGPLAAADGEGWRPFRPRGRELRYFIVATEVGEFTFTAPWGEPMAARPGDAIVQNPERRQDTYRVAAASFACTYEILTAPP